MSESKLDSATVISDILETQAVMFHDQYKEAFIAPDGYGNRIIKLNSRDFKDWLSAQCWNKYGEALSSNTTANIIQALSGHAKYQGTMHQLAVRCAMNGNGIWYDCGSQAVQISEDGWNVLDKPPKLFRRYSHQTKQVLPEKGGDVWSLMNYVNIEDEEDKILFLVYSIAAFIPDFPHPLLVLHGSQGAGKSTPMRALKSLVDPSALKALPPPRDAHALAQLAHHHALLFFDNLSHMPMWLSDALARASTGDGFSKRALYTDDDDVVYVIQRPIALNGINQVITKADLLDRSILLKLQRIEPERRMSEDDLWAAFNTDKPRLLGAIFDVISKALTIHPNVQLNTLPRMADFASWGYAIAEAAGIGGEKFIEAYLRNIDKQNDEVIDASPVAQAIIEFMRDIDEWSGTAADLLQRLKTVAFYEDLQSSPLWPKDPQWLTKRINEVETTLQNRGIFVRRYVSDMKRITHLSKSKPKDGKAVETVNADKPIEDMTQGDILDSLNKNYPNDI